MLPQQYRITDPTLAMFREDGHHVARTVPVGALITVTDGKPFDGERLTEVEWNGRIVMMFTHDLRESTAKLNGTAPLP